MRERGATFRLGLKFSILRDNNIVSSIIAGNEKISGDVYVATGGSETTELLMNTGYNPRILPAIGLAMLFNTHGEKIIGFPADMEDYGIGLNQHNQNVLRVTSFMDLVGFNKQVSASRKESLLGILKRHLSNFDKLELVLRRNWIQTLHSRAIRHCGKSTRIQKSLCGVRELPSWGYSRSSHGLYSLSHDKWK